MRHIPEAGAVCGNSARTDLCGGRGVTSVPTATRHHAGSHRTSRARSGRSGRAICPSPCQTATRRRSRSRPGARARRPAPVKPEPGKSRPTESLSASLRVLRCSMLAADRGSSSARTAVLVGVGAVAVFMATG